MERSVRIWHESDERTPINASLGRRIPPTRLATIARPASQIAILEYRRILVAERPPMVDVDFSPRTPATETALERMPRRVRDGEGGECSEAATPSRWRPPPPRSRCCQASGR